jgi:hypothetical protein
LTKYEILKIEADLLADQIQDESRGVYGARPHCPHWPIEKAMLFIRRNKITSNMKYHLTSQLNVPKLRAYIMAKEKWSDLTFDNVYWTAFETAFKRLSKNIQTAGSRSCHNLWHTGKRNGHIYRGKKACCFCNTEEEVWNHALSCGSLNATLVREASWAKVKKAMAPWTMPPDFWTAIEKGLQYDTRNASQNNKGAAAPFPGTFNNPRNLLRQAFREQDEIGWSGIFKGRIATQWKVYIVQHLAAKRIKLKMQEWAPKLINTIWDHTTHLWHYRNDAVHSRDNKQAAQFKITALEREKERIKIKHEELRHMLHAFQSRHLERRVAIAELHYNGQKWLAELARLYLDESENRIIPAKHTI